MLMIGAVFFIAIPIFVVVSAQELLSADTWGAEDIMELVLVLTLGGLWCLSVSLMIAGTIMSLCKCGGREYTELDESVPVPDVV